MPHNADEGEQHPAALFGPPSTDPISLPAHTPPAKPPAVYAPNSPKDAGRFVDWITAKASIVSAGLATLAA